MPSTRDIRRRIKSVKNTAKITKAMQMVAASKMKRAQEAAISGRPYARQYNKMLSSIVKTLEDVNHPLLEHREDDKPCVLLVTSDKGLCGALNTNVLRETTSLPDHTQFATLGRKGRQFISRTGKSLMADFSLTEKFSFKECQQISKFLIVRFLAGEASSISILYPRFVNTLINKPVLLKLLPISEISPLASDSKLADQLGPEDTEKVIEYQFEPSPQSVLDHLLPYYVHFMIYQAILSARASEHSARMVAMKSATDNANQLVKDLTLEYNKARQASITNEILEISTAQLAMG